MLSRILFDVKPDEIHQNLAKKKAIPVIWSNNSDSKNLSIWSRVKNIFQQYALTDQQLIHLIAETIKPALTALEPSIACHVFHCYFGADYTVYKFRSFNSKQANMCTMRIGLDPNFFHDDIYVPSSAKNKLFDYSPFDTQTFQIIYESYVATLNEAQSKTLFNKEEFSDKFEDISKIFDIQHITQLTIFKSEICQLLPDVIVNYLRSEDDGVEAWWLDVDLLSTLYWYDALQDAKFSFSILIEEITDVLSEISGLTFDRNQNQAFREFATIFLRYVLDVGEANTPVFKEEQYNLTDAIDYSFDRASSHMRSDLSRTLRLMVRHDRTENIFDLIPS